MIYYNRSANQGNSDGRRKVGDFFYYGRGVGEADAVSAAAHYRIAVISKPADSEALYNLGYMYEYGIGIDQVS